MKISKTSNQERIGVVDFAGDRVPAGKYAMNACATFLACRIRPTFSDGSEKSVKNGKKEKKERFLFPRSNLKKITHKFCSLFRRVIVDLNDIGCLYGEKNLSKSSSEKN